MAPVPVSFHPPAARPAPRPLRAGRLCREGGRSLALAAVVAAGLSGGDGIGFGPAPAWAQSAGQTAADRELIGRMQVRIAELERLVQDLTGKVEEALYANRRLEDQLQNQLADMDFRLNALEGNPMPGAGGAGGGGASGSAVPPSTSQSGILGTLPMDNGATADSQAAGAMGEQATVLPDAPAAEQYNFAFSLLRRADYAGAEQAFKAFLEAHPGHNLSGNAQYWLGETYYVRGDYEQAAVAFMSGYQTYPDSTKAPDNLLKLGLAMNNLGKTREACAAFTRLSSQYPRAPEAIKRRADAEVSRLGC